MPYYPPSGSLSIGTAVIGGNPSRVLITDGAGLLADSAALTFDSATNILSVGNRISVTNEVRAGAGSAATPTFTVGDPDTGIFGPAANQIGFSTNGAQRASINATGDLVIDTGGTLRTPDGTAAAPTIRVSAEASGLFRRAAGEINIARAGQEMIRINANGPRIQAGKLSNGVAASEVTTVGAAGGAAALPATPLGYLQILLSGGGTGNVPYYNP